MKGATAMENLMEKEIAAIRDFNRYYTNLLGILDQHFLKSPYSLSEIRVLYEINKYKKCTIKKLSEILTMDEGYLSRIIKKFQKEGILEKARSETDGRSYILSITKDGQKTVDEINRRSDEQIYELIKNLSRAEKTKLTKNMESIITILSKLPININ